MGKNLVISHVQCFSSKIKLENEALLEKPIQVFLLASAYPNNLNFGIYIFTYPARKKKMAGPQSTIESTIRHTFPVLLSRSRL